MIFCATVAALAALATLAAGERIAAGEAHRTVLHASGAPVELDVAVPRNSKRILLYIDVCDGEIDWTLRQQPAVAAVQLANGRTSSYGFFLGQPIDANNGTGTDARSMVVELRTAPGTSRAVVQVTMSADDDEIERLGAPLLVPSMSLVTSELYLIDLQQGSDSASATTRYCAFARPTNSKAKVPQQSACAILGDVEVDQQVGDCVDAKRGSGDAYIVFDRKRLLDMAAQDDAVALRIDVLATRGSVVRATAPLMVWSRDLEAIERATGTTGGSGAAIGAIIAVAVLLILATAVGAFLYGRRRGTVAKA